MEKTNTRNNMGNRTIKDLCGNEYFIQEAKDKGGTYLEVHEVVNVDGKKMKTYLCELGMSLKDDDNEILDEIDDLKAKFVNE